MNDDLGPRITTSGGKRFGTQMEYEEMGPITGSDSNWGSDWSYDSTFEPGGSGGSSTSNEIIWPDLNIFTSKPFEICNKSINVKTIGNGYNAYLTNLGITLVNSNGRIIDVKILNLYITVPNYNISSGKFEESIKELGV